MDTKTFKYRKNTMTETLYKLTKRKIYFIFNNLTKISALLIAIGFINLWAYLYRIEQLDLLTLFLSSPSTLLAIFASLALIIIAWISLLLLPTIVYSSLVTIIPKNNAKRVISHSIAISIILSVLGTSDMSTAIGLLIFTITWYICYFTWLYIKNRNMNFLGTFFISVYLNIFIIIIIRLVYNLAALSDIHKLGKITILLFYIAAIYYPLIIRNIPSAKWKTKKKKLITQSSILLLIILYPTIVITPGLMSKLNNYTIYLAGLRSDEKSWYKLTISNYPSGWLEHNWEIKSSKQKEIWVQGYPTIQNSIIKLICPEKVHYQMNIYLSTRLNIFAKEREGSMDTKSCILIKNNTTPSVKITENKTAP
ncbi:hypothetical protein ACQQKR_002300 [Klebsiella quasipneumoniae]